MSKERFETILDYGSSKIRIGVFDDELKEDDYDDIKEKKIVRESNEGWLGITDKYWMTAFVPETGKNFKSTFLYDEGYKANYIILCTLCKSK